MLRDLVPTRVLVSLGVAFAFVGAVVVAGVLLRDRDPAPRAPPVPTSTTIPSRTTLTSRR